MIAAANGAVDGATRVSIIMRTLWQMNTLREADALVPLSVRSRVKDISKGEWSADLGLTSMLMCRPLGEPKTKRFLVPEMV